MKQRLGPLDVGRQIMVICFMSGFSGNCKRRSDMVINKTLLEEKRKRY